jgi:UMF1 family MFS transporter
VWSGLSVISKRSLHSYTTSSFEADDERSEDEATTAAAMSRSDSSDGDGDSSRPRLDHGGPEYSGYDARHTSSKELMGWYAYGFASETFVICGMGMSGRAFLACPRARNPIARACSVSHPPASSKTDNYRD